MRIPAISFGAALLIASSAFAQQKPLERLQSNIERITQSINAQWGIYIKCLETGEEIAIHADDQMETMSVIKIPLLVESFRQIEAGKFSLTDRVTLTDAMKRPGTGVIRSMDAGAHLTIKDMLTMMIIVSDNTATEEMYNKAGGLDPVNKLMDQYGYKSIRAMAIPKPWFDKLAASDREKFVLEGKNPFGLSTPREMGHLIEKIRKGEAVSKNASEMMMQMLRGQVYTTRLPKYVTGFRVAHKTGDFLPYVANDVGVMESRDRNIVICVFANRHTGVGTLLEDAEGRIAELIANYYGGHN